MGYGACLSAKTPLDAGPPTITASAYPGMGGQGALVLTVRLVYNGWVQKLPNAPFLVELVEDPLVPGGIGTFV
jgi:hypothetical protein